METISENEFRDKLEIYAYQVANTHSPIKVTRQTGGAFIVINVNDWKEGQETVHVLQNNNLMNQVSDSMTSHKNNKTSED